MRTKSMIKRGMALCEIVRSMLLCCCVVLHQRNSRLDVNAILGDSFDVGRIASTAYQQYTLSTHEVLIELHRIEYPVVTSRSMPMAYR